MPEHKSHSARITQKYIATTLLLILSEASGCNQHNIQWYEGEHQGSIETALIVKGALLTTVSFRGQQYSSLHIIEIINKAKPCTKLAAYVK